MAARRCPVCGINYPLTIGRCRVCETVTDVRDRAEVDPDWQRAVAVALAQPHDPAAADPVSQWRRGELARLGFAGAILDVLAEAGTDIHQAADLLNAGCPLDTAARILI